MSKSKEQKLASKKRKIEAFLNVAQLNDVEGRKRPKVKDDKPLEPAKNENLEGEELQELRKRLRERKKLLKTRPNFRLKSKGYDAALEIPEDMRTPLLMRDLQHLLLYALMGTKAPIEPSKWCLFEQWNKLTHVNILAIDGLGLEDYMSCDFKMKNSFCAQLDFVSPSAYNSSLADDLSILPLSAKKQYDMIRKYRSLEKACDKGEAIKVFKSVFKIKSGNEDEEVKKESESKESLKLKLMLSMSQMLTENYPIPLSGFMQERLKHYIYSADIYEEVTEESPLYSVDCEFCMTKKGLELTKVCVVDSQLNVVYNSLVKPDNPITNYLTRYSGITAEMLIDVTTKLSDVQNALKSLLPPNAIWIGQSLNNDLHKLQMFHPYVIDTSVIYNISGDRGRKTKLKTLSHMFLGEDIQTEETKGHDPKEDAIAAMKLVLLKLEKGYDFGDAIQDNVNLDQSIKATEMVSTSIFKEIKEKEKKITVVASQPILDGYEKYWTDDEGSNVTLTQTENRKESIEKACNAAFSHDLTLCHVDLNGLEDAKKLSKTKKWTKKVWEHTSTNGLFVTVWTGSPIQRAFVGIALNKASID